MNIQKLKKTLINEFKGWKLWEIFWLILSSTVILITSFFFKDNWIGITGAVCGIIASVLTGKGKLSAYIIGGIGRILYAFVAFKAAFYGEVILNLLYFVPMEFYGIYVWNKNMNGTTHEVNKRSMSGPLFLCLIAGIVVITILFGLVLKNLGGELPFIDSFTNTISILAMIVTIQRYWQQWILWILTNIVSIIMWIYSFTNGSGSIAILIMWFIYLINSIIMLIKWTRSNT